MQSSRGLRGGSNECLYNTNLLMSTFASRSLVFSSTKSAVMTYLHDSQLSSTHGHLQLGPSVRHTEKHGQAGTRTKLCVGWVGLGLLRTLPRGRARLHYHLRYRTRPPESVPSTATQTADIGAQSAK